MGKFPRARTGDKIGGVLTADVWNELMRVAEAAQRVLNVGQGYAGQTGHNGVVLLKNSSGSNVDRFGVLGLGAPIITASANLAEFKNAITFIGTTPATGTHERKFGVLLEPIKNGEIGHALIQGVIQVQLDVVDTDHKFADIKNSDRDKLQTGFIGAAEILWQASGMGTQWATVRIGGGPGIILGKTDASHAKGASGTVSIWTGTPGSEADTGENVTAYNRFGALGSGKWVMLCHNGFGYYLVAGECG